MTKTTSTSTARPSTLAEYQALARAARPAQQQSGETFDMKAGKALGAFTSFFGNTYDVARVEHAIRRGQL